MAKKKSTRKIIKKLAKKVVPPKKSADVPATQAMIYELRREVMHSLSSQGLKINSLEKRMNSLEQKMDARFKEVDARFDEVDARFDEVNASIKQVLAQVHRVGLLVEEQNARNKYVLDGYTSLNDRVEKLEKKDLDENL